MTHRCPAEGCTTDCPRHILMCARHWRMVPRPLQTAIRDTWRSGHTSAWHDNKDQAVALVSSTERGRKAIGLPAGTKALTIWQPWTSLIMVRAKPWEFRGWNFADKPHLAKLVGQRIVLHAGSRKPSVNDLRDVLYRIEEGESALDPELATPLVSRLLDAVIHKTDMPVPFSAALGTAVLGQPQRCVDLFRDQVADSSRIDEHMYAWPLTDVTPFDEPIPAAGAQGFWNWS